MIRYHARWVVPIATAPIVDGTVCVEGDRIAWVGTRDQAPPGADVDLGDAVLLPGLVNAHTHLELTAMRGFLEGLDFKRWILRLTSARREVLSRDDLLHSARLGIAEGLLAGVTTYADTCESGVVHEAMRDMRVRGLAYQEVFGPDPAQCADAIAALRSRVESMRREDSSLVRSGVSPHAPYSVSDALFTATAAYAGAEALPIAVHVAESEAETDYVTQGTGPWAASHVGRGITVAPRGRSPVEMLARDGVLRERPLLIHCVRVDEADLSLLRSHDCAVAHCPASNAKLGHGVAPLARIRAAGIRVGLGSDSVASNNRMDILDEARLAVLLHRADRRESGEMDAPAAMALATVEGARALDLGEHVGTLVPGKQADLAAFRLDSPRTTPAFDPAVTLLHAAAGRAAWFVTVAGQVLVRDGRLVRDVTDSAQACTGAATRLARWAGSPDAAG